MLKKKFYANGQPVYSLKDEKLTYYFKNGTVKASGSYINGQMEGEWIFYREGGQLWQTENFQHNQKHGNFLRYDRNGKVESEGLYKNDELSGIWYFYDKFGKITEKVNYDKLQYRDEQ